MYSEPGVWSCSWSRDLGALKLAGLGWSLAQPPVTSMIQSNSVRLLSLAGPPRHAIGNASSLRILTLGWSPPHQPRRCYCSGQGAGAAVDLTLCRACRRSMSRVLIPHSLQSFATPEFASTALALQQTNRAKGEGERELINKRAIVQSSLYHNDGRTLPCLGGQSPWGDELCDGRSHNAQTIRCSVRGTVAFVPANEASSLSVRPTIKDVGRGNPTGDRDQQNVSVDVRPKEASVPGSAMSSWLKPLDARRKNACTTRRGANFLGAEAGDAGSGQKPQVPLPRPEPCRWASAPSSPKQAKEETRAESGQQKK
ncbi:hypothetical protein CI102_12986 [Trichoderma harzianum]|nr:hypothetical protein CI102_12986 [Trichoderma harzianum]